MLYKKEEHKLIQKIYLLVKWALIFTVIFSLDPYMYTNKRVFISIMQIVLLAGMWNGMIQGLYHLAREDEKYITYIGIAEIIGDLVLVVFMAKAQSYYGDGYLYLLLLVLLLWSFMRFGASFITYSFVGTIIGVILYLYENVFTQQMLLGNQKFIIILILILTLTYFMHSVSKENQRLKMLLKMKENDVVSLKADVNKLNDLHKISSAMYETSETSSIVFSLMDNIYKLMKQTGIKLILYGENEVESDASSYVYAELMNSRLINTKYIGTKGFYGQKEFESLRKQRDYKNCLLAHEPIQLHKNNITLFQKILPNQDEKYIYIFNLIRKQKECGIVVCSTNTRLEPVVCRQIDTLVKSAGSALTRAHMLKEARDEAMNDKLTGTKTRRYLDSAVKVLENKGTKKPISVLFGDIDHFKQFNDRYGHHIGDYVLQEVAAVMSKHANEDAIVGRYGGEEFVMLMYGVDEKEAYEIAEDVRQNISQLSLEKYVGEKCYLTISLGIATYPIEDYSLEEVIKCADKAMYKAKITRNAVCIYNHKVEDQK